jgi:hypothetical protein
MKRLLSAVSALAFAAALGSSAFADTMSKGSMASSKTTTSCPTGKTWVKPYTKKDGTKVKGYCKSSSMKSTKSTKPAPAATK